MSDSNKGDEYDRAGTEVGPKKKNCSTEVMNLAIDKQVMVNNKLAVIKNGPIYNNDSKDSSTYYRVMFENDNKLQLINCSDITNVDGNNVEDLSLDEYAKNYGGRRKRTNKNRKSKRHTMRKKRKLSRRRK